MRTRPAVFSLAALFALPAFADVPRTPPPPAEPPSKAACSVDVILARTDGNGPPSIDPQLAALAEDLKKPPFSTWKTFKRVDRKDAQLVEGGAASFTTPDGRSGSITYGGHVHRGAKHAIKVVLDVPGGTSSTRAHLTLDEGGHTMVAGLKHQGGIVIYAVSCKTEQ